MKWLMCLIGKHKPSYHLYDTGTDYFSGMKCSHCGSWIKGMTHRIPYEENQGVLDE